MIEQRPDDYDGPWKEALETYFEDCLAFFFPQAHAGIDWTRGYEFLDKELQQVAPEAELGPRTTDKLIKVWHKSGQETWVLIHIEVQSQYQTDFAERMYIYNYRLFDRYNRRVASLAILGDLSPTWRPSHYGYTLWDCEVSLTFPTVKLLDYNQEWAVLEASPNPFAVVVMAHLQTQATRNKPDERYTLKWYLIKRLFEQGYSRQDIQMLFRFIDWLMALPPASKQRFEARLIAYEKEQNVTFTTTFEQRGIEKGIEEGIEKGILQNAREAVIEVLETRFETVSEALIEAISGLEDATLLKKLLKQAVVCESLAQFEHELDRLMADQADQGQAETN